MLDGGALPDGRAVAVTRVLVRDAARPRAVRWREDVVTTAIDALLDARADVVVEAIGGLEPAGAIAEATLARGGRFVTANKALVAARGAHLAALATRTGGALDFEAAAGGAIPIVRALRDGAAGVGVRRIAGVLNGTTNFVLGRLAAGDAFADAVRQAQAAGFAEADPSRDLDGRDAGDKLALLAWLAFGVAPHMLPVRAGGVAGTTIHDAACLGAAARAVGGVVRQVAEAAVTASGLVARVQLAVVAAASPLGRTEDEGNAVVVESASAGAIVLAGKGAGGDPTAGALLGDLHRPAGPLPLPQMVRVAHVDPRVHDWLVVATDAAATRQALAAHGLEATERAGVVIVRGTENEIERGAAGIEVVLARLY
jgi:homoserine dehydrogenase